MNPVLRFAFLLVLACQQCFCQNTPSTGSIPLRNFRFIPTAGLAGNGISLYSLGGGNSFYVQMAVGGQLENGIRRISFDGRDVQVFDVNRIIKPASLSGRTPYIESFIAGPDQNVYVLTRWLKGQVSDALTLLTFSRDGTLTNIAPVPLGEMQVVHFARFDNGGFVFLAGSQGDTGFDAIDLIFLDDSGNILSKKTISQLSKNEKQQILSLMQNGSNTSPRKSDPRPDIEMEALLARTLLFRGDDGYVYMIRSDKADAAFRLSRDGEITKIHLLGSEALTGNTERYLMNGALHGNSLMLAYGKMQPVAGNPRAHVLQNMELKIYDLANGNELRAYSADPEAGGMLVGWDDDTFYFLKFVKNVQPAGFEIVSATP